MSVAILVRIGLKLALRGSDKVSGILMPKQDRVDLTQGKEEICLSSTLTE